MCRASRSCDSCRRSRSRSISGVHVARLRRRGDGHLGVLHLCLRRRVPRVMRHLSVRMRVRSVDRLVLRRPSGLRVHLCVRLVADHRLMHCCTGRDAVSGTNSGRARLAHGHRMNRDRRWRSRANRDWYNRRCRHRRDAGGRRRLNGHG